MIAARTGRVDAVHLLPTAGADGNATGWAGQTVLMGGAENHGAVVKALITAGATLDTRSTVLAPLKRRSRTSD